MANIQPIEGALSGLASPDAAIRGVRDAKRLVGSDGFLLCLRPV